VLVVTVKDEKKYLPFTAMHSEQS